MNREGIRDALVAAVTEIQSNSGRPVPEISDLTCPILDLQGFDSLNAVEAAILLGTRIEMEIDENILISKRDGKSLSLGEIADELVKSVGSSQGDH